MKFCPSCGEEGISIYSLSHADPASPTRCRCCGKQFYMARKYYDSLWLVANFGIMAAIIGSFLMLSIWPLLLFMSFIALGFLLAAKLSAPIETTNENVAKSRKYKNIILLVVITAIALVSASDYL